MFLINLQRILRNGLIGFLRNGFISFTTILIMSIALFSVAVIMFTSSAFDAVVKQIEERVDINVYFATDASEEDIMALKKQIEALPEVKDVEYISKDKALALFRERHKDEPETLKALDELGENPLGASLAIRAKQMTQYESIAKFLEGKTELKEGETTIIEHVNYYKNKPAIDKINYLSSAVKQIGFGMTLILLFAAIAIVFNTIRLAIYTMKDEISVMKLVGASNWYAQGPFVVEGALYGLTAGMIVYSALYPIAYWLHKPSYKFFGNFSTLQYFESNALILFIALVLFGILLGALSSFFAARRYL